MNNLEEGVWYHKEHSNLLKTALNLTDSYCKKTASGKYIWVSIHKDYIGIDYINEGFGITYGTKPATQDQIKKLQKRLESIV